MNGEKKIKEKEMKRENGKWGCWEILNKSRNAA